MPLGSWNMGLSFSVSLCLTAGLNQVFQFHCHVKILHNVLKINRWNLSLFWRLPNVFVLTLRLMILWGIYRRENIQCCQKFCVSSSLHVLLMLTMTVVWNDITSFCPVISSSFGFLRPSCFSSTLSLVWSLVPRFELRCPQVNIGALLVPQQRSSWLRCWLLPSASRRG